MFQVMLRPNWPGHFRRTVTVGDKDNQHSTRLDFEPGDAVSVAEETLLALVESGDIGAALCLGRLDEAGRCRPDWDGTQRLKDGEPLESVFAEPADDLAVAESLIPGEIHGPLKEAGLLTLTQIDDYLKAGKKLSDLKGIGDSSEKKVLEALELHSLEESEA